jgi:DNA-binding SARP family transcriptional activator
MSEKGMASRISQLVSMFKDDAARLTGTSHRDLVGQFERLGATTHASANTVIRNSRSQESGPIEQARLFMMGPLRLMRPYSYMELGESAFGREGARMLLTALVAAEVLDRVPTREELAAQVAPKARTQEQQKKALYNAASAVRTACASPNSILAIGASNVELNTNPELEGSVWVDALEIVRSVRAAKDLEHSGETGSAFDHYQHALQLARKGDFAADIYAEWVDAARDRLREVVRDASLATARIALRTGLYPAGIEAMSTQLTRDPFDEEAHRHLIRLYNESGNRSAALKQIEKCRKIIMREFGVELEPETLRLRQEIMEISESVSG